MDQTVVTEKSAVRGEVAMRCVVVATTKSGRTKIVVVVVGLARLRIVVGGQGVVAKGTIAGTGTMMRDMAEGGIVGMRKGSTNSVGVIIMRMRIIIQGMWVGLSPGGGKRIGKDAISQILVQVRSDRKGERITTEIGTMIRWKSPEGIHCWRLRLHCTMNRPRVVMNRRRDTNRITIQERIIISLVRRITTLVRITIIPGRTIRIKIITPVRMNIQDRVEIVMVTANVIKRRTIVMMSQEGVSKVNTRNNHNIIIKMKRRRMRGMRVEMLMMGQGRNVDQVEIMPQKRQKKIKRI